jgi:hypothetical protein
LYKFETLFSFEVLPLRLDAAIPAPLPMLETLSKIFNGNAFKGRQRIAVEASNSTDIRHIYTYKLTVSKPYVCGDVQHSLLAFQKFMM